MRLKIILSATASVFASALACATAVQAQERAETASDQEGAQRDIVVTGSRLASTNLSSPQPVVGIGAEEIARSGAVTAADVVNELPQLGNAFGASNQDISVANRGFNVGTELINLRGLGAQRTLVLVNGRRHIASDPGTTAVDLNAIPSALIDRIEIVTGANSAVYGADAVSGVVNIILKDRYDGIKITARSGISSEGDGFERGGSIFHGGNIGSSLRYVVSAEYFKRDAIFGHDRDWIIGDGSSSSYTMGAGSSAIGGGRFFTTDPAGTWTFPSSGGAPVSFNSSTPLYQRVLDRNLQVPLERGLLSGRLTYDAGGGTELFLEASYARTSADLTLEPSFFQFAATQGVNAYDLGHIPTNAPGLAAFLAATGATGINGAQTQSRRLDEYGVRTSSIDRDLYRVALGAQGDLGRFHWQAYYQYGRVDTAQEDGNSIDRNKFYAGLNNCEGAYALTGCVPINIFGHGSISQEAIDWTLIPDVVTRIRSQQHVASAFISGDVVSFGDSALGAVVGVEYRRESTRAHVHPSLMDGSNATRQIAAASGSTDVREVFGELHLPLFQEMLELNGAARLSDYSSVGAEVTWNASATFRPAPFVSLRASYGKATRAPNVGELFSSINTATSVVNDPCANDVSPQDGTVDAGASPPASCVSQLGAGYIVSQAPGGTPTGNRTGGNPDLRSETGRTFSAGAVFRVPSLLRFTGSIDYYDIKLDDVIGSLSPVEVVRQCYVDQTGLPDAFCSLISRNATGSRNITTISTQLFNIADERVRGLDAQARISWPLAMGRMSLGVTYAHLFERARREFQGGPNNDFTGRFDAIRDQANVQLEFGTDAVTFSYGARILGAALKGTSAANRTAVDDPAIPGNNSNRIPAYVYHDLQATFRAGRDYSFTLGVKNLTDRQPPLITSFSNSGLSGSASVTAGGIYDTRGRFFYAQVGVEF